MKKETGDDWMLVLSMITGASILIVFFLLVDPTFVMEVSRDLENFCAWLLSWV